MRLEIELRCILFPLIILELFVQLDWYWYFGILLGSPLAVAKAAATLPGVHTNMKYNTE